MSQLFSEKYKLAVKYHLRYSRYADDITFSSNRNVFSKNGEFCGELNKVISSQGFVVNEKKTRLQNKSQRQEVTGLTVNSVVNVSRDYVRSLDNLLYIWEKYGESAAYARFIVHYTPKQNLHKHTPSMISVVRGKLLYLKMVKGADSEVWRRLQRRFDELCGVKSSAKSADVTYKRLIKDFEKESGCLFGVDMDSEGNVSCHCDINGRRYDVALSSYVRTRLTNIMKNGGDELDKFKASYLLVSYEGSDGGFWRIERRPNMIRSADEVLGISMGDSKDIVLNSKGNIDEILASLVNSGFEDLSIIDEWDKTKDLNVHSREDKTKGLNVIEYCDGTDIADMLKVVDE